MKEQRVNDPQTMKDTAPIRTGEELDADALERYLRGRLPELMPGETLGDARMEIEQFPGGHSNLTYLVRLGGCEFVLRRPPFGPVAPTAHDMPREFRLLSAVHPHFNLAPRTYLLCEDASIIGVPFYLMERRRGLVIRRDIPEQIRDDLRLRRRVSRGMVDTLAALHSVDIYSTGLLDIGKPVGFVTRQVRGWTDRWNRSKTSEVAEIDEVIGWLAARIPPEPDPENGRPATLVHNDFKLDNVMLDPDDPSRVVAVLDWEMCTAGDPLIDVGIFLCYWAQKDDPEARRESISPVTTEPGWMSRDEITERYAMKTGRELSGIAFYEVFALFKVAVVLQQIYFRFVRGQTSDERFKDFDRRVAGLARAALELAERSGI
ncbi:MAG TPA: phosphotransferase family protein [Blastocatellia bacterium]|jgi:aminoglycoside phosphotransferase (APT) family kinase protein|nr:phosphotransferase family protein [Blastocatellia bacterium]